MIEMEIMFLASFYKASNILMPKSDKGTPREFGGNMLAY